MVNNLTSLFDIKRYVLVPWCSHICRSSTSDTGQSDVLPLFQTN